LTVSVTFIAAGIGACGGAGPAGMPGSSVAHSGWRGPSLVRVRVCAACGQENPPDARFCNGCGAALAAGMWIAGVGARMVFYFAATHGAGPAIAAFSIAHHITGSAAWTAALVMMALADVLTRLVVVYLRGRRLSATGTPIIAAAVQAGAGA